MERDRWAAIESLYHAALARKPGERSAWLRQTCGDDPALLEEVESLLACADARLSNPGARSEMSRLWDRLGEAPGMPASSVAASSAEAGPAPAVTSSALPPTIGRYRILRLLGEGGMGIVYEAEQEHPRRTVALKVIKSGLADAKLVRRFEQESLALGRLQHPGIAQIYEAGTADTGFGPQPYFAMEYIRGESLLQHAKTHQLGIRRRLEVMAKICEAVHHAHQRGIIHRDLKPGNILVDETGQPKILDFGVARATDSDARVSRQTDLGQLVGTLAYMSPEQVFADPLELDTRSDVYSLGVVMYEFLSGQLPYRVSPRLHEAVQTIREEEPRPLSTLDRTYRGDLETIVEKALEKERARRYSSAAELGADIRRYLQDEPIMARPTSAAYQIRKFARRHRALVLAVAAVFVVLIVGIIVSTREAARANAESATSRAISDFLQNDLLAQASAANQLPNTKPDPDLKVRTALDRAAARIGKNFRGQPEVEAAIRDTIGRTYGDLGLYPEAHEQLVQALDLERRTLGAKNPRTLQTMSRLGNIAELQGKYPEAEALLSQALAMERRALAPQDLNTLYSTNTLANVFEDEGKYPQAEALYSQTLEIRRRMLGPEHRDTLGSMNNLALIYYEEEKYPQAEALSSQTLEIRRRVLGPEHPDTLASMTNLASIYGDEGKYAQAEALTRQTLEIQRRVLGPEHPDTLMSMGNLALTYGEENEYPQAEALYSQTLDVERRVLGREHPETLGSMNNLAIAYYEEGKYPQAEALSSQTLEVQRRVLGPEHPDTLESMSNLADSYGGQGKYAKAEELFNQGLKIASHVPGPEKPLTLAILSELASLHQKQGKYALAEKYAAQAFAGRRHALGFQHPNTMASAADLALADVSQGKFAEAEPLAREALETEQTVQPDAWQRYRVASLLGASLVGEKKYAEAEPLLLEGYQGMAARKDRIGVPDWYQVDRARVWLVQLYQAWGKPAQAAEWRKKSRSAVSPR